MSSRKMRVMIENLLIILKQKAQSSPLKNILTRSFVVKTIASDCTLRCRSFDQIAEFVNNANARYGESLGSGRFLIATPNNSSYFLPSIYKSNLSYIYNTHNNLKKFHIHTKPVFLLEKE